MPPVSAISRRIRLSSAAVLLLAELPSLALGPLNRAEQLVVPLDSGM